ncbi:MAG: ABC transporter ATP-binding protein/permease [Firmicutes bacterium]|nr:ABC transporter ATP-binding protein/permease [Bacillota bacterium]
MFVVENISKKYRAKDGKVVDALRDVSYTFPERGMIFVVGKSGSGKSTMLNILGLLDSYDEGQLIINGKSCKDMNERERDIYRAHNIGFVFQDFHIIEKYTIGKNISLPLEIKNKETNKTEVADALAKVGLVGFEKRKSTEVSGGQRQRVAIARALIKDPKIILADEPTGNLDSVTSKEIFTLLKELSKEKLVVVISHDLDSAHAYADTIVELADGQITDIYAGEGNIETIKFIGIENIPTDTSELVKSGKRVILVPATIHATNSPPQSIIPDIAPLPHRVRLPISSAFRLSLIGLRAKWVRMVFMIMLAMFATAFFGFADMIGRFDVNQILLEELNRLDKNYVSIGMDFLPEDASALTGRWYTHMDTDALEKFNELGIPHVFRRDFPGEVAFFGTYQNMFRGHQQAFSRGFRGVIEADPRDLGFDLIYGRMAENANEIVITSYHLEAFKRFGYIVRTSNTSIEVNSFDELAQAELTMHRRLDFHDWLTLQVVGVIDVDLSKFREILDVNQFVQNPTAHQRTLLREFNLKKVDHANMMFSVPGFYNSIFYAIQWPHHFELQIDSFYEVEHENIRNFVLNENAFNHFPEITFCTTINSAQDFTGYQAIISTELLDQLLPTGETWNGRTLHLRTRTHIQQIGFVWTDIELEIIGIIDYGLNVLGLGHAIYHKITPDISMTVIVPNITTSSERLNLIRQINSLSDFDLGRGGYHAFIIFTPSSFEIYGLDRYFSLFVTIFAAIALAFCIFSMILIYGFISGSINARKKDIGILRSLGAGRRDVVKIFAIESIIIAIPKIILGIITCYIGYRVATHFFVSELGEIASRYRLISFGMRQIILISVASIVAIALAITLPIIRIARKQPLEVIRG